jgi:hypothetical protein
VGDFKLKFERIDQLDKLDLVSVYFYETNSTHQNGLNRFAQFIDKDGEPYYE